MTVSLNKAGIALHSKHRALAASIKLSAAGTIVATTASFR